ncbi:MAG: hypothetical protein IKR34_02075 [Candidatus Gastranaerophilales bacterium]|nr:hypothetical protein [Elusimicrobiota bacterium]MBR6298011.1 hypothetical protein [Candidatus Gastranaerophilales bacterium]
MTEQTDETIGFKELLLTTRVIDSKNHQCKLGKCIDFELDNLMQAINEYNKGGKLTITIDIGVAEKNELNIQAEVKTNPPKGKKPSNPFYRDYKGRLFMDDPNQMKLIQTNVYDLKETHQKGATAND